MWVSGPSTVSRTAEAAGQALNVDLCFVPASHETEVKLPAVSGSSGRLVIERPADPAEPHAYAGRIFEDASLDYTEAMLGFAAASLERKPPSVAPVPGEEPAPATLRAQKRALGQAEAELRRQRGQTRRRRQQEDAAWLALRQERRTQQGARRSQSKAERSANRDPRQAQDRQGRQLHQQRQQHQQHRTDEDALWRQQRQSLRQRLSGLPIVTAWIAILVITDNCTRQCLGACLYSWPARE